MPLSTYLKVFPDPDRPGYRILFSTKCGATIAVGEELLQRAAAGMLTSGEEETLAHLGFWVTDPTAEQEEMRAFVDELNRQRTSASLTVILNLACNMDCVYCFEGEMKGSRFMAPETADRVVEMIERDYLAHGKDVELTFYGGEPLLSTNIIRSISRDLLSAAERRGCTYSFMLVTNGTLLTPAIVDELIPFGLVGAKVTLDGPRENHDRFRPLVGGGGSFDLIVENLRGVCDRINIQVGGNYSRDNYHLFPQLLDTLIARGLTPDRLARVKFDPITQTAGEFTPPEFTEGCCSPAEPWVVEASTFLREEILRRGFASRRTLPIFCMIELEGDFVITWDGKLYKCPVFIGFPDLAVGSVETGLNDYTESHAIGHWKNERCMACAYLPLCFGGCRFLRVAACGRVDGVECFESYLDMTIERFVMQDLKYLNR
ncbi:MAG: putative geopeptide radical SAM maturase [Desulfuromonadales bacterium]|nr:MAG: putative geopeptide radical SAM maturase [Desulfuromonadales bacterium]